MAGRQLQLVQARARHRQSAASKVRTLARRQKYCCYCFPRCKKGARRRAPLHRCRLVRWNHAHARIQSDPENPYVTPSPGPLESSGCGRAELCLCSPRPSGPFKAPVEDFGGPAMQKILGKQATANAMQFNADMMGAFMGRREQLRLEKEMADEYGYGCVYN